MTVIKKSFMALLFLLLATAVVVTAFAYASEMARYLNPETSLMFDDSFMFIRYAKIWLLGHGEAWNISEAPAYGNTSQLHFLLVLLLTAWLNLPIESLSALSSILPSVIVLLWLPYFCARQAAVFQKKSLAWRYGLWLSGLFPLLYWNTPWGYHSGTGMDAMLSLLMHLLLIDAVLTFAKQKKQLYFLAICVLAYLAYLTRPDNLLTAVLFPLFYLGLVLKLYRQALIFITVMGVAVILDAIIKYLYFGDYFPLAYYSKRIGFLQNYGYMGEIYNSPFRTFFVFLLAVFPFLALLIFSANKKSITTLFAFLFPAAITLAYYFTMIAVMNYGGRYFFPFLPYFIACAVVSLPVDFSKERANIKMISVRLLAVIILFVLFSLGDKFNYEISKFFLQKEQGICDDSNLRAYPENLPRYTGVQSNRQLEKMLASIPAGVTIAMSEHGYVGASNPHVNIIDLAGLHNHYLAHEGFTAQWLFEQKPDAIWAGHWQYTCLNASIFDAKEFWDHYELYPHLFSWSFALRKDSPHYDILRAGVEKTWGELYPELDIHKYVRTQPLESVDYGGNKKLIEAYEQKRASAQQR